MNCLWRDVTEPDENGWREVACVRCGLPGASPYPHERIYSDCLADSPDRRLEVHTGISADEARELFGDSDPTLLGNRIKALTDAIGIPPCGGCEKRRQWLNKAHAWLRGGP